MATVPYYYGFVCQYSLLSSLNTTIMPLYILWCLSSLVCHLFSQKKKTKTKKKIQKNSKKNNNKISSSLSCVSSNNTIPTKGVDFNNNKTISFFRVHHHKKPRSWLWWVFCLEEHSSSSRAFALAGSRDVHIVKIITLLSCFCVISFVSSVHF